MNQDYLKNMPKPNVDQSRIRQEARQTINDTTFERQFLEETFSNFFEAFKTYQDDYDPNKFQYQFTLKKETKKLCFDKENIPHLFGLSNYRYFVNAYAINDIIMKEYHNNYEFRKTVQDKGAVEVFKELLEKYQQSIISKDTDQTLRNEEKINWDKIADKVYSFLNLGILSEGNTVIYRENISNDLVPEYCLVRDIATKTGKEKVVLHLVPESNKNTYVPKSIIRQEFEKAKYIDVGKKRFIYSGQVSIEQKEVGKNKSA